jgi:hypothetical protein
MSRQAMNYVMFVMTPMDAPPVRSHCRFAISQGGPRPPTVWQAPKSALIVKSEHKHLGKNNQVFSTGGADLRVGPWPCEIAASGPHTQVCPSANLPENLCPGTYHRNDTQSGPFWHLS